MKKIIKIERSINTDDILIKFVNIEVIAGEATVSIIKINSSNPDYNFYKKMIGLYEEKSE